MGIGLTILYLHKEDTPINRQDFTLVLANLIIKADNILVSKGMALRLTWGERSAYDQLQCFNAGTSKCDGVHKISAHQNGLAADLILIGQRPDGKLDQLDPRKVCPTEWATIRQRWVDMGGEPMLPWDACHFEVK